MLCEKDSMGLSRGRVGAGAGAGWRLGLGRGRGRVCEGSADMVWQYAYALQYKCRGRG